MTKVNLNNGNETISDIFPWDIIKSDSISFFYQNILKYFSDFQNRYFSIFMTKVNPDNRNETKTAIFPSDIFKYDTFFIKANHRVSMTFKIKISQFFD